MKTVMNFLTLRPMWTRRGIEIVWCIYLFTTLIQLGTYLVLYYSFIGASVDSGTYMSSAYMTLSLFSHLALVRIILEIAIKFLRLDQIPGKVPAAEISS